MTLSIAKIELSLLRVEARHDRSAKSKMRQLEKLIMMQEARTHPALRQRVQAAKMVVTTDRPCV